MMESKGGRRYDDEELEMGNKRKFRVHVIGRSTL